MLVSAVRLCEATAVWLSSLSNNKGTCQPRYCPRTLVQERLEVCGPLQLSYPELLVVGCRIRAVTHDPTRILATEPPYACTSRSPHVAGSGEEEQIGFILHQNDAAAL
jgi:hypothetical protein